MDDANKFFSLGLMWDKLRILLSLFAAMQICECSWQNFNKKLLLHWVEIYVCENSLCSIWVASIIFDIAQSLQFEEVIFLWPDWMKPVVKEVHEMILSVWNDAFASTVYFAEWMNETDCFLLSWTFWKATKSSIFEFAITKFQNFEMYQVRG